MSYRLVGIALGLAVLAAACSPVGVSNNTVDNFSGTLQLGGANAHTFVVARNGEVEVSLTSVAPSPQGGALRVGLGQPSGPNCAVGTSDFGIPNRTIQFGILNKGTYCVLVFDPGVLTVAVSYTGTISHP